MNYSLKIHQAIRFATKTHEVYQKQKRKGKDIPYIIHPLTVGLILARVRAAEEVIVAGILHDTIEDSHPKKKVSYQMLQKKFSQIVADLVLSVTEQNKKLPWAERKKEALEHIRHFSHNSLLIKSADLVSNLSETLDDHQKEGDKIFERFNASKEKLIENYLQTIAAIIKKWSANPLLSELRFLARGLKKINKK